MLKFRSFLIENKVQWLKDNLKEIGTSHDALAQHQEPHAIIDHFASADPTPNKNYTQWMVNRYHKGDFRQEDHARVGEAIRNFHTYKGRLEKKDIGQYKKLADVEDAVEPHLGKAASKKEEIRQVKDEGADLIHHDPATGTMVHRLKNHDAACRYGAGTRWCTASRGNPGMFNSYSKDGPIYVVHDKEKKRQIHFPSNQFMDERDSPVHPVKLVAEFPSIRGIPEFQGKHIAFDQDDVLNKNIAAGHRYNSGSYNSGHTTLKNFLENDSTGRLTTATIRSAHSIHGSAIEPEVYTHPNVPSDLLERGIRQNTHHASILKNPNITTEHISKMHDLLTQTGGHGKMAVGLIAKHPKTHPDVLHAIAGSWQRNMDAADHALNNPNVRPETFHSLHGQHEAIDASMASSKRTPSDLLQKLKSHPNPYVATEASRNLGSRG